jgi:hypothetical protein
LSKRSIGSLLLLFPSAGLCWDLTPPCKSFWDVDAVFTALVLDDGLDHPNATWGNRPARLKVEQIFAGLGDEKEIEIDTGITTECYLRLRKGQRYFIYAKRAEDGGLRTSDCLGTVRLDLAGEDLQFARRLKQGGGAAFLFGATQKNGRGPLAGVEILASGQGKQYRAITDQQGKFKISPVEPGEYEIRAALAGYASQKPAYSHEVHARGCAEVEVNLVTGGRIGGRLTDSMGALARKIQVDLAVLNDDGEPGVIRDVATDDDGRYEFTMVTAGVYAIGVNLAGNPSPEIPFAPTRTKSFPLAEGERLSGADLRLPPKITGTSD